MVRRRTTKGAIPDSDGPSTNGHFAGPEHVVDTPEAMIGAFVETVDGERWIHPGRWHFRRPDGPEIG